MSRRCAHFHGATARIDDSAIRAWIGIEKSTRSSQVVATLHHSHVRGAEEQLQLRIEGAKLLPNHAQPRQPKIGDFVARRTAFEADSDDDFDVGINLTVKEVKAIKWPEQELVSGDLSGKQGYVRRSREDGNRTSLVSILVSISECFRICVGGSDCLYYYVVPVHVSDILDVGISIGNWVDHEMADHIEIAGSNEVENDSDGDPSQPMFDVQESEQPHAASAPQGEAGPPDISDELVAAVEAAVSEAPPSGPPGKRPQRLFLGRTGFSESNQGSPRPRAPVAPGPAVAANRSMYAAAAQSARRAPNAGAAAVRSAAAAPAPEPVNSFHVPAPVSAPVPAPDSAPVFPPAASPAVEQAPAVGFYDNLYPRASILLGYLPEDSARRISCLNDAVKIFADADGGVPNDALVPTESSVARISFLDWKLKRIKTLCDRQGVTLPVLRPSSGGWSSVFDKLRELMYVVREVTEDAREQALRPRPSVDPSPAPAPASALSNSFNCHASGHQYYSALHMQQSGLASADKHASEEERALWENTRIQAQTAATQVDREHHAGGGPVLEAAAAIERATQGIAVPGAVSQDALRAVGQLIGGMPSALSRLVEAPVGSFSQVSSEGLNRSVTHVSAGIDMFCVKAVPHVVDWLAVDSPAMLGETRQQTLRSMLRALHRGDLDSKFLWESTLLKKGGDSMWASLEAGNPSVTCDLLEALDKATALFTTVPAGDTTIFARARSQIKSLVGQLQVDHGTAARYIASMFQAFPSKKFRAGSLLLKPQLLGSYFDSAAAKQAFDDAKQVGSVLRTISQVAAGQQMQPANPVQMSPVPVHQPPAQQMPVQQPPAQQFTVQPGIQAQAPPLATKLSSKSRRALKRAAEKQAAENAAKVPACPHAAAVPPGMWYPQCTCGNGVWAQAPQMGAPPPGVPAMAMPQPAAPFMPQQCVPVAPRPAAAVEDIPPQFQVRVPDGRVLDTRQYAVALNPNPPAQPVKGRVQPAQLAEWSKANGGRCWAYFNRGFCVRPAVAPCAFTHA